MLPILCLCDFPDKNSGVGCCFLLQGIFPTQGSNPCLPASPALAGRLFTTKPPGKPAVLSKHWLLGEHWSFLETIF